MERYRCFGWLSGIGSGLAITGVTKRLFCSTNPKALCICIYATGHGDHPSKRPLDFEDFLFTKPSIVVVGEYRMIMTGKLTFGSNISQPY